MRGMALALLMIAFALHSPTDDAGKHFEGFCGLITLVVIAFGL